MAYLNYSTGLCWVESGFLQTDESEGYCRVFDEGTRLENAPRRRRTRACGSIDGLTYHLRAGACPYSDCRRRGHTVGQFACERETLRKLGAY